MVSWEAKQEGMKKKPVNECKIREITTKKMEKEI